MNPFELFDLDPLLGLSAITEQLRDRMADARRNDERDALRAAWEALTLVPQDRFRFALLTPPFSADTLEGPQFKSEKGDFGLDTLNQIDFINLGE